MEALERNKSYELEYRIIRSNGQVRWIYEKGQTVQDETGLQRLDGAILDVPERKKIEQDKVRLGKVLEDSLNDIFIYNAETLKSEQVNHGARQHLGYTMAELSEMTALDIKPELSRETFEELIAPMRNCSTQRIVFNTVHRRKDGTLYSVESNTQLSSHDSNQFFLAIVQDTTERDKARAEIKRLSLVAERTNNAVMITGADGRLIKWANDAFMRMSEYSLEEVVGKKPGALLQGPETSPDTVRHMRQQFKRMEDFNVEVVNYAKSVRKFWPSLDVQPVRGGDGVGSIIWSFCGGSRRP